MELSNVTMETCVAKMAVAPVVHLRQDLHVMLVSPLQHVLKIVTTVWSSVSCHVSMRIVCAQLLLQECIAISFTNATKFVAMQTTLQLKNVKTEMLVMMTDIGLMAAIGSVNTKMASNALSTEQDSMSALSTAAQEILLMQLFQVKTSKTCGAILAMTAITLITTDVIKTAKSNMAKIVGAETLIM